MKRRSARDVLCDCDAVAYLRFRHLNHYFMEPDDLHDAFFYRIQKEMTLVSLVS
jgi:hypothetical protein